MSRNRYTLPRWLYAILAVLLILIGIRAALPGIIKNYINDTIDQTPEYSGGVKDVDLRIIAGGFAMKGLEIYKDSLSRTEPLFSCERIGFSILWRPLFRGNLIGSVALNKPQLALVAESESEAEREAKDVAKDAPQKAEDLLKKIPVRIDEVTVQDGRLDFRKFDSKPPIHVFLADIQATARNLTNSQEISENLVAKVSVEAKAMDHAPFSMQMSVNPWARPVSFDLQAKLIALQAKSLNPVTKEYGKFDFEKGRIDLVAEVAVRKGIMNGYVKPLLKDIEIAGRRDRTRDGDPLLQRIWERLVGAAEEVLENQPIAQSGTKISLQGPISSPDVGVWDAAVAVLRNAFVKALLPTYEPGPEPPKTAH